MAKRGRKPDAPPAGPPRPTKEEATAAIIAGRSEMAAFFARVKAWEAATGLDWFDEEYARDS